VTGAYAALAEYYSNKQTKQNDCGLNLGWSHPNARATRKSVNNIKNCAFSCRLFDCTTVVHVAHRRSGVALAHLWVPPCGRGWVLGAVQWKGTTTIVISALSALLHC
jgi:hypothetical protein